MAGVARSESSVRFLLGLRLRSGQRRSILEPGGLQILQQAFPAALASVAAFAVAAKSAGSVEQIGAVDPHHSGFKLRSDVQRDVDALAPHASRQSIHGIVRQFDRFAGSAEGHRRQHRTKNFLLRHNRSGMNVAEQRGRIIKSARRQFDLRLPAGRALGDSLIHQPLDSIQLHPRHDRADVDGLVERRAGAQGAHTVADFGDERLGNALLHQQARTGAANLSLIEPDAIDQAFDRAIEIGVFENNEGRLAAQFEREPLMAGRSGGANRAAHFG